MSDRISQTTNHAESPEAGSASARLSQEATETNHGSFTDKVGREINVIGKGTGEGFVDSIKHSGEHPLQLAESIAAGGGLMLAMHGPAWMRIPATTIGAIGGIGFANHAIQQIGATIPAISDTWKNDNDTARNKATISKNLGALTFDTTVMGLTGALAFKAGAALRNSYDKSIEPATAIRNDIKAGHDATQAEPRRTNTQLAGEADRSIATHADRRKEADRAAAELPENRIFPPRESSNSTPIPGRYDNNGLWLWKQTLDGYSKAEIEAATAHLSQHYHLGKPEILNDFVSRFKSITEGWAKDGVTEKLTIEKEQLRKTSAAREAYDRVSIDVINELGSKIPTWIAEDLKLKPSRMKDFLLSDSATMLGVTESSGRARIADNLINERTQYAKVRKETNNLLEGRTRQVQQLVDQLVGQYGLSEVKIAASTKRGSFGSYSNGELRLDRELLGGTDAPELANTLYHELLHHEQYHLMIGRLADKLNIGAHPTAADREKLAQSYSSELSRKIVPEHYLIRVLNARDGRQLSPDQAKGADILLDTTHPYRPSKPGSYITSGDMYYKNESLLKKLDGDNGQNVVTLIKQKAKDQSNLLEPFNTFDAVSPPKVSADPISWEQSRKNLVDGLKKWQNDINLWRQQNSTEYRGRKIEWDAWLIDSLVNNAMIGKTNSSL